MRMRALIVLIFLILVIAFTPDSLYHPLVDFILDAYGVELDGPIYPRLSQGMFTFLLRILLFFLILNAIIFIPFFAKRLFGAKKRKSHLALKIFAPLAMIVACYFGYSDSELINIESKLLTDYKSCMEGDKGACQTLEWKRFVPTYLGSKNWKEPVTKACDSGAKDACEILEKGQSYFDDYWKKALKEIREGVGAE